MKYENVFIVQKDRLSLPQKAYNTIYFTENTAQSCPGREQFIQVRRYYISIASNVKQDFVISLSQLQFYCLLHPPLHSTVHQQQPGTEFSWEIPCKQSLLCLSDPMLPIGTMMRNWSSLYQTCPFHITFQALLSRLQGLMNLFVWCSSFVFFILYRSQGEEEMGISSCPLKSYFHISFPLCNRRAQCITPETSQVCYVI